MADLLDGEAAALALILPGRPDERRLIQPTLVEVDDELAAGQQVEEDLSILLAHDEALHGVGGRQAWPGADIPNPGTDMEGSPNGIGRILWGSE